MTNPILPQQPAPGYLIVARTMRPHGIRGAIRVQALTGTPDRMHDLETVYFTSQPSDVSGYEAYQVVRAQHDKGDQWFLYLEGITERDQAERFRARYILVTLEDAVPLAEDEVYLFQVIGLEVQTESGVILGRVVDVMETGANDVYVVQGGSYGDVLLPAIDQVIKRIDPDQGVMIIAPMPGLLPQIEDDNP